MIRKTILAIVALIAVLAAVATVMYVRNATPEVAQVTLEAARSGKPFVVKLHAQWCPVCMTTKSIWSRIEATYAGRVNLVVFDFTDQASTDASRAEARRLGLDDFFNATAGWTGAIAVVDGRTLEEKAAIQGSRDFAEYQTAIDAALMPRP